MRTMADTSLRQIREGIGATREDIVRRTRTVSLGTVRNAETGRRVTHDTAMQILEAINALRVEAGQPPVVLDDLGLTLY
jgi:DNA-binding transcriptional regulator YiaG